MVDFVKHALFAVVIGYQVMAYGMLGSSTGAGLVNPPVTATSIQAVMIIAFLCYTPAVILGAGMIVSPLRSSKLIAILNAALLIAACVFCIAGLGVQGTDNVLQGIPYVGTFIATAGVLAVLAAVFYILSLCCGGPSAAKVESETGK